MKRVGNDLTFVRFVLPFVNGDTGTKDGIFEVAYTLRREGNLKKSEYAEINKLLRWFGENLAIPKRFNRTKSKGYFRRNTKGISWFKSSAMKHVMNMHLLADLLRQHGHHVSMIKTKRPGYVVYEDEHQVVAEPFNDLRE